MRNDKLAAMLGIIDGQKTLAERMSRLHELIEDVKREAGKSDDPRKLWERIRDASDDCEPGTIVAYESEAGEAIEAVEEVVESCDIQHCGPIGVIGSSSITHIDKDQLKAKLRELL